MATSTKRKRVEPDAVKLTTEAEVEQALARIGTLSAGIKRAEGDYNEREQMARKALTAELQPSRDEIKALELGLADYAERTRATWPTKSLKLVHGVLSFRLGTPKVDKDRKFTLEGVVDLCKRYGGKLAQFVRTKEELDKEAVLRASAVYDDNPESEAGISAEELATVGLKVVQEETFGYEVHYAVE